MHRPTDRTRWRALTLLLPLLLLPTLLLPVGARAHHGWGWASAEEFEISGVITAVRLGNPHGEVTLDVDGERWVVEVGQPWRNARAGLSDDIDWSRVGAEVPDATPAANPVRVTKRMLSQSPRR